MPRKSHQRADEYSHKASKNVLMGFSLIVLFLKNEAQAFFSPVSKCPGLSLICLHWSVFFGYFVQALVSLLPSRQKEENSRAYYLELDREYYGCSVICVFTFH